MSEAYASYACDDLPRVTWRISSKSDSGGASCVEAGPLTDHSGRVAVRHSHHPNGETFVYGRREWDGFLARIKSGDLDFPA